MVSTSFYQRTAGISALTGRPDPTIDDLSAQLAVAFDVRHHPDHVPRVTFGNVGSEARASKVDVSRDVEMTNLVKELDAGV